MNCLSHGQLVPGKLSMTKVSESKYHKYWICIECYILADYAKVIVKYCDLGCHGYLVWITYNNKLVQLENTPLESWMKSKAEHYHSHLIWIKWPPKQWTFKGCVCYIFASLFLGLNDSTCQMKKNVFYFEEKCFLFHFKTSFYSWKKSNFRILHFQNSWRHHIKQETVC